MSNLSFKYFSKSLRTPHHYICFTQKYLFKWLLIWYIHQPRLLTTLKWLLVRRDFTLHFFLNTLFSTSTKSHKNTSNYWIDNLILLLCYYSLKNVGWSRSSFASVVLLQFSVLIQQYLTKMYYIVVLFGGLLLFCSRVFAIYVSGYPTYRFRYCYLVLSHFLMRPCWEIFHDKYAKKYDMELNKTVSFCFCCSQAKYITRSCVVACVESIINFVNIWMLYNWLQKCIYVWMVGLHWMKRYVSGWT